MKSLVTSLLASACFAFGGTALGLAQDAPAPTPWAPEAEPDAEAANRRIELYKLVIDGDGVITYNAPDGMAYSINPAAVAEGAEFELKDQQGRSRMYFLRQNNDSQLRLSVRKEKAGTAGLGPRPAVTLLHAEDDHAEDVYRIAGDEESEKFNTAHAVLKSSREGINPFKINTQFYIMVVYPTKREATTPPGVAPPTDASEE